MKKLSFLVILIFLVQIPNVQAVVYMTRTVGGNYKFLCDQTGSGKVEIIFHYNRIGIKGGGRTAWDITQGRDGKRWDIASNRYVTATISPANSRKQAISVARYACYESDTYSIILTAAKQPQNNG